MAEKPFMPIWGPYSKKYMGLSRIMGTVDNKNASQVQMRFALILPFTLQFGTRQLLFPM